MSATVETVQLYAGVCWECKSDSQPYDDEEAAGEWAATHNAECHETDTSDDEAYEAFKESRYAS